MLIIKFCLFLRRLFINKKKVYPKIRLLLQNWISNTYKKEFDFDNINTLSGKTINIPESGAYPLPPEHKYNLHIHTITIDNVDYQSNDIPDKYREFPSNRIHHIELLFLHNMCKSNFINHIISLNYYGDNRELKKVNTLQLDEFLFYLNIFNDPDYNKYWKEIILNILISVNGNTELSAYLDDLIKPKLIDHLNNLLKLV